MITSAQKAFIRRSLGCGILLSMIISGTGQARAERNSQDFVPSRYGLAVILGNTYDPGNEIQFSQISGFVLHDYDRVWHHPAPDPLRFKIEGSLGATASPRTRVMASCGIMALYYLDTFATQRLRPYGEAGIGIIYTDFQVKGQGLRLNFNPQAGFGMEFLTESGSSLFTTLRLHHLSNGDLYKDNRGVNAVVLVLGYFFR